MGAVGVVRGLLMDKEVDKNILDKDSCSPLCLAIRQENTQAALLLIEGGADVNVGGGIFGSPLHLATVKQKTAIIESLVKRKADLNM